MRLYSLDRLVNPRLVSDATRLFDRRFGRGNWHYLDVADPTLALVRSPLACPVECTSLDDYRRWLWQAIQEETPDVTAALEAIQDGQSLIVRGDTSTSHGQVVIKARRWQQASPPESSHRLIRERRSDASRAPVLFDLDQGYLKVVGQGGSRVYDLAAWRWSYHDMQPAIVREDGRVRRTTVGAQMALLDRGQLTVPQAADQLPLPALTRAVEQVRARFAPDATAQLRWRCHAELAGERLPTELILLSDGSLLDVSYESGWHATPSAVQHYHAAQLPTPHVRGLMQRNQSFRLGALRYRPL